MSVKYNKAAFDKVIVSGCREASWAVAQQIRTDTYNLIPKDTNMLRAMCRVVLKETTAEISWNMVYARRQYEVQASHYTTEGTGPRWVEKAEEVRGEVWKKVAQNAFAKGMK